MKVQTPYFVWTLLNNFTFAWSSYRYCFYLELLFKNTGWKELGNEKSLKQPKLKSSLPYVLITLGILHVNLTQLTIMEYIFYFFLLRQTDFNDKFYFDLLCYFFCFITCVFESNPLKTLKMLLTIYYIVSSIFSVFNGFDICAFYWEEVLFSKL